jgi:hypothetical protein
MIVAFCACSFVNSSSRISIRDGRSVSGIVAAGVRGKISEVAVSNDSVLSEESSSSPKEPMLASGGSDVLARLSRVFCCKGDLRPRPSQGLKGEP